MGARTSLSQIFEIMSEEIKRPMTPGEAEAAYLTIRQRNILTDAGLDFSDLQYVSKWDILHLRNMGRHSIEILTRALAACGLTWGRYRLDEFKEKRDQIVAGEAITRRLMAQAQEPDACIDWEARRWELVTILAGRNTLGVDWTVKTADEIIAEYRGKAKEGNQ